MAGALMPVLLDFETRSRADLKKVGGRRYAEHPSTEALCCVLFDTETEEVAAWQPGEPCPVTPDSVLGAHNAMGFDRFIAERLGWRCADWIDTSELARRAGLPGALDALGTRWLNLPKDKVSSRYTASLSKIGDIADACPPLESDTVDKKARARERSAQIKAWKKSPRAFRLAEVRRRVQSYCASDVEIVATGWPQLRPYVEDGVFAGWEADVSRVDRAVNDRGICFDVDLATALLAIDAAGRDAAIERVAKSVGVGHDEAMALVNSPKQFCEYTGLPNAQAKTIEETLRDYPGDEQIVALCKARQALATIARGKLEAGLARVSPDSRLRDSHRYYAAHTGRFGGRGFQSQNIPRPEKRFEEWGAAEVDALITRARRREQLDPGEVDICLRATHCASPGRTLAVADFAGVEARGTAWVAGDAKAIEVFLSGRDVYKINACQIFPGLKYDDVDKVQRTAGKMAELACGYQGGPGAVERIALANGNDLCAMGIDLQAVVDGWRALHPPIVRLWRDMNDGFLRAAQGHYAKVKCFEFVPSGEDNAVAMFLPSGRPVIYNNVQIGRGKYGPECTYIGGWDPVWKCTACGETAPAPLDVRAHDRAQCSACSAVCIPLGLEKLYGGLLTENAIQAMCRDLMCDALVRAEDAGLCPVLHVHDEIVCDVPGNAGAEAQIELEQIMLTLPEWAKGFPVGAAGHHGVRYRK